MSDPLSLKIKRYGETPTAAQTIQELPEGEFIAVNDLKRILVRMQKLGRLSIETRVRILTTLGI